jgi:hypothetical protein
MDDRQTLEERVARLERINRRLTKGLTVAALLIACTAWMGQRATGKKTPPKPAAPKVVEAERFLVKKASGQVAVSLGVVDDQPVLSMFAPDLTERVTVSLAADGLPRLALLAPDGKALASLAVTGEGITLLDLATPDGAHAKLGMGGAANGLTLADAAGKARMAVQFTGDTSGVSVMNGLGVPRIVLTSIDRGPGINLNDPDGKPRVMLSVRPEQSGLGINDDKGGVRAGLAVRGNQPAFALYDANGKALFIKP